mgnify:CR=1 FL=1|jgi:hypothetical protein
MRSPDQTGRWRKVARLLSGVRKGATYATDHPSDINSSEVWSEWVLANASPLRVAPLVFGKWV